jgi:peptide/nickel transport system substrate-binding protein
MTNLIVNREVAPFNDQKIRRAMALSLDRKAFIDILSAGKADIGGVMLPPPEGVWGMPPDVLKTLPGYSADVEKAVRRVARSWRGSATARPDRLR